MEFVFRRSYVGPLQAVIFDWAGTTIDHGCFAPVVAIRRAFAQAGIAVDDRQAREPMGLAKRDHLEAILSMEPIARQWQAHHGRPWSPSDLDALYASFVPLQLEVLPDHVELVPGTRETVDACRERGLKIGSTTGYSRRMMELVLPAAAAQGYRPDHSMVPDDVLSGRPAPWMCFRAAEHLQVYPMETVVKIGDTVPDVEEGLNAGMWVIAVTQTSSELGLTTDQVRALTRDELAARLSPIKALLRCSGAHYVVPTIADVPSTLDLIEQRLHSGDRP